jgi:hypothetical protein
MRTAIFWDITQRVVAILYRRFWTTYWYHLQDFSFWILADGTNSLSQNFGKELPILAA